MVSQYSRSALIFLAQLLLLPALQHGHIELGFFKRLGQVILSAQADGFDHRAHFVRAGKHDHVQGAVNLHQLLQGFQAIQIGHQHVQNDEVRTVAVFDLLDRLAVRNSPLRPDTRPPREAYPDTSVCWVRRPPRGFFPFQPFAPPSYSQNIRYALSIGSRNVKVQPRRGSLSTQILPRCACTSRLAIARPNPIPDEVRSTRTKSSKIS